MRGPGSTLAAFALLSASYFAHIGFFNPYLPLWLKEQGLGLFAISLLSSTQSATRLFAPYAWGWLSDHTGERVKLLRFSATVATVCSLGLWLVDGPVWIGIVLLLMFMHTSSMMSMSEAAMAHLVSGQGAFDARRYGRVRLWGSLGFLVTVLLAGAWFDRFGMRDFPAWTLATLVAVTWAVWRLPDLKEHEEPHADGDAGQRPGVLPVLRRPEVRWFFAAVFFHVLSHIGIYVFFSLYLDALGYSKGTIGALWAVSVVLEIAWFFTQGRWLPRLSLPAWLVLCAVATVLRMGLTAGAAGWLAALVVAQVLHALSFAAHHAVCIALITEHFPGRLRGRGQALYTVIGYGFTGVIGGLLGGALSARLGLGAVYWAAVLSALAGLGCAWKVWRPGRRA